MLDGGDSRGRPAQDDRVQPAVDTDVPSTAWPTNRC